MGTYNIADFVNKIAFVWLAGLAPRLIRPPLVPLLTSCQICAPSFSRTRKLECQRLVKKSSHQSVISCRNLTHANKNLRAAFRSSWTQSPLARRLIRNEPEQVPSSGEQLVL